MMEVWLVLYILVNLFIFVFFALKRFGVFQAPFLMAYISLFVLLPQYISMLKRSYPKEFIDDLGFMMFFCNLAFFIGYLFAIYIVKNKVVSWAISYKRIKFVLLFFTLIGFYSIFTWNEVFQGSDNVIQSNLKSFSQYALCLSLVFLLKRRKKDGCKLLLYIIAIINLVPLIYFAFFIKGSRGEILFLLLVVFLYLSLKYVRKERLFSKFVLICLILGSVLSVSITIVRYLLLERNTHQKMELLTNVSFWTNYTNSFSAKESKLGSDLENAGKGIQYLKNTHQLDYGTYILDNFVQNYVPRRVVGEQFKNKLKLNIVNDSQEVQNITKGVTTMTGYYSAFRGFSYWGFILMGGIGYLYGFLWVRKSTSQVSLFIYLSILSVIPLIFTHGIGYLYSRLFFIAFFLFPISFYAFYKRKVHVKMSCNK